MYKISSIFLSLWILFTGCSSTNTSATLRTDIFVLGGSEAGFTAAIQAARMDKKVILLEPTGHPGGMLVEGLGKDIRFGNAHVIGGIAKEFYFAVEKQYGLTPDFNDPKWYSRYEPSVAEKTIEDLLSQEANIQIIRKLRIKEIQGVKKKGSKISSITLADGTSIEAKVYIDASIEGHLLHFAGVHTETIREGNALYGESLNGVQGENTFRQFTVKVDPYQIEGDTASGLIPTLQTGVLGRHGEPSPYIQGFCFRMCLTNVEENRIPISQPTNYDPAQYEIYRRYLKAGGQLFKPSPNRHNGKTDIGSWHDLSANLYGENWQYPAGDYTLQDSIIQYHRDFTLGLLWFLQNDPSVDSLTRAHWEGWGLPKDEFTDNGHWPRRLYIRSGRRMVSDYIITEHQTARIYPDTINDAIAIAWWPPDVHHARRIVRDGFAYNEGFTHVGGNEDWKPFRIAYRATIPKSSDCTNILTPTCLSSSYIGYGSIRIVPTFMVLGQSVGAAASLAIDAAIPVQAVPYRDLQKVLNAHQQILQVPSDWPAIVAAAE